MLRGARPVPGRLAAGPHGRHGHGGDAEPRAPGPDQELGLELVAVARRAHAAQDVHLVYLENDIPFIDVEQGWPASFTLDDYDALLVVDTGTWSQLPGFEQRLKDDTARELKAVVVVHNETSTGVVSRIADGDTFECVEQGRVRLIGIDAPEQGQGRTVSQRPFQAGRDVHLGLVQRPGGRGCTEEDVTAYREDKSKTPIDFDALPAVDVDVPAIYKTKQFSQEVQAVIDRGPLAGILGAFLAGSGSGALHRLQHAADGTSPPSDLNGQSDYRQHLARVLTGRAVLKAAGV